MLGRVMTISRSEFDPVAVVIDWLDACKGRRLVELLDLYDDAATIECACNGEAYRGRPELEEYWRPKLADSPPEAFGIDDVLPDGKDVVLDYRSHDGKLLRIRFRFNAAGKIMHTSCSPKSPGNCLRA
jgi:hypothetical protein